jgi:shikimate kinase
MIIALIGHRGSGKSSALERWRNFGEGDFVDLDQRIEDIEGKSVASIFLSAGEKKFRQLEKEIFFSLYDQANEKRKRIVVALGAGFEFDLPQDVYSIWVQRETDLRPRTFLDRPRLSTKSLPSDEYLERASSREIKFSQLADEQILYPEGFPLSSERVKDFEERFFSGNTIRVSGILTLAPQMLVNPAKFDYWLSRRQNWKDVRYELRTDLLEQSELIFALNCVRGAIYSFRSRYDGELTPAIVKTYSSENLVDWAIELGNSPYQVDILSLHDRHPGESLGETLKRLEGDCHLKAAPIVNSFAELWEGFQWQQEDPANRSFLPRSNDGRWRWFRILMKDRQELNYVREGRSTVLDQPSLMEWANHYNEHNRFAAVLGDPIEHSFTPAYQSNYFNELGTSVLRVRVTEKEWDEAIPVLENLGMRYAAVTSPLKGLAGKLVGSPIAVNTLYWNGSWIGENTDIVGAKVLNKEMPESKSIAVWGGGGVLPALSESFPNASYYSASTGKLKQGQETNPETLIWAVGRKNMLTGIWPSPKWKPKRVIDLNYSDDSPGKEYALLVSAEYSSGIKMFLAQANEQRNFWSQCER